MTDVGRSVVTAYDYVWDRFVARLDGLTDEEYLWEPVPGAWTLRRDTGGHWYLEGEREPRPPDPAPVTTIAWRVGHLAGSALAGLGGRLFGTAGPIELAGTVDELPAFLAAAYHRWRPGMVALDEDGWMVRLGPAFGPYADANRLDMALHVFDEVVHHGAEVALLRDLYRARFGSPV
jgi:hypothetical protein